MKDADQRGQVERHIENAFGNCHTTTNHSLGLGFTEGEKPEKLYSHVFRKRFLKINTRLYPGGHPSSYNPVRSGLTWNSVVKGNALTASAVRAPTQKQHNYIFYCLYLALTAIVYINALKLPTYS